jgi:hypothetical protein
MEILDFLLHWQFWAGVLVGWVASPHLNKLVSKFKK